jgi:NAD(P)-dependent dehydrogenase (short-subunit alcohol dehydrogenase family)
MTKSVLITGSNSGIGRATAETLAAKGYRIIATMRTPSKGADLADAAKAAGHDLTIVPLDVTSDDSVKAALEQAGDVDILVNNAGFEVWGPVEEVTVDDLKDQFETNVYGPFRLIKALLPSMRQRESGVIVNVSSVAGRVAAPLNGAYAASKFALEALTESLLIEAGHWGVRVHLIEPGRVATPFADARRAVGAAAGKESPYVPMLREWEDVVIKRLEADGRGRSTAQDVADVIVEAIEKGDKLRYPVGADAAMVFMARKAMDDEQFLAAMRAQLGIQW